MGIMPDNQPPGLKLILFAAAAPARKTRCPENPARLSATGEDLAGRAPMERAAVAQQDPTWLGERFDVRFDC